MAPEKPAVTRIISLAATNSVVSWPSPAKVLRSSDASWFSSSHLRKLRERKGACVPRVARHLRACSWDSAPDRKGMGSMPSQAARHTHNSVSSDSPTKASPATCVKLQLRSFLKGARSPKL